MVYGYRIVEVYYTILWQQLLCVVLGDRPFGFCLWYLLLDDEIRLVVLHVVMAELYFGCHGAVKIE